MVFIKTGLPLLFVAPFHSCTNLSREAVVLGVVQGDVATHVHHSEVSLAHLTESGKSPEKVWVKNQWT